MADTTIVGVTLAGRKERDAIHIAVAPVIATHTLHPGEHIGFIYTGDTENVGNLSSVRVGIVDPFLTKPVERGERFWMFLYPNTITSLKHVWTHPAFGPEATTAPVTPEQKADSEEWLRNFVAVSNCPDYETVLAAATGHRGGQYLHFDDIDAHGQIPPEFWDHIEILLGEKVVNRATYFSCSC